MADAGLRGVHLRGVDLNNEHEPRTRDRTDRGGNRWLLLIGVLVALGLGILAACDGFSPREPETPSEIQPIIILSHPDSIYVSMQLGLSSKFITTYINCFDPDDFVFHPDRDDSTAMVDFTNNPQLYDNWNVQAEERAHSSAFGVYDSLRLVFVGEAIDSSFTTDEITLTKEYLLTADEREFTGQADWVITRKAGEWRITFWQDQRIETSWSVLKGENR